MGIVYKSILSLREPGIKLEPLIIPNIEESKGGAKMSKMVGILTPIVEINKKLFYHNDISSMYLNYDGFMPYLTLVIIDGSRNFESIFPKEGDILKLYISSNNDIYKSIRIDFEIIEINSNNINEFKKSINLNYDGVDAPVYTFNCRMHLDGIYIERNYGLNKDSSFNHLMAISEKYKLGFASNIEDTNDSMVRINPYISDEQFMKNIIETAYKDDESYFTGFIDLYYYLNFIDINKQFEYIDKIEEGIYNIIEDFSIDRGINEKTYNEGKLFLTNFHKFKGYNNYITSYKIINESGKYILLNGYGRYLQYYDYENRQYRQFRIVGLKSKNMPEYLNKNMKNKDILKYKYMGYQSDNVFDEYYYAYINNYHNFSEMYKYYLQVELYGINLNIYRYQCIPIIIYDYAQTRVFADISREESAEEILGLKDSIKEIYKTGNNENNINMPIRINKYLTGYYVVGDIYYNYNAGGNMYCVLNLLRKEWPEKI